MFISGENILLRRNARDSLGDLRKEKEPKKKLNDYVKKLSERESEAEEEEEDDGEKRKEEAFEFI